MTVDYEAPGAAQARAALARRVKKRSAEVLKPLGFVAGERQTRTLVCSHGYTAPRPWFFRLYYHLTVRLVLELDDETNPDAPPREFFRFNPDSIYCSQFGVFAGASHSKDWDTPTTTEEEDAIFEKVDAFLKNEVAPLFEKYRETDAVLRDYDAGTFPDAAFHRDSRLFSGGNPIFNETGLGVCRFRQRRFADALAHFEAARREVEKETRRIGPQLYLLAYDDDLAQVVEIVRKML